MKLPTPATQAIYDKWQRESQEFRACDLCAYGTGWEGMRYCHHSAARFKGKPVEESRKKGGHCGPEAHNLYIAPREITRQIIDNKSRAAGEKGN